MIWRTVVMLVLMLAVALPAAPAEAQRKRLACTQAASSHYAYCVGASKAINLAVPDVDVSVVETGATVEGKTDDIPKLTIEASQSPLHAGAIKYFPERGLKIPDHLIPAEAK